jgi:two-component system response regulator HydG
VNLKIPPLRERRADIAVLAEYFVERMRKETGKTHHFSEDAMRLLMEYDWPGNVRELQHAIERTCAMSSGPVLHMVDLPTQLQDFCAHQRDQSHAGDDGGEGEDGPGRLGSIVSIADMEKQAILGTIRQLKGDKLMAARLLGIGKTTLYRKLKEYGLTEEEELIGD